MEEHRTGNITNARTLRKKATDAERLLWKHLRMRQLSAYKFRRQQPIGSYIVDFVCLEKKLIIELDGGQHTEQASVMKTEARGCGIEAIGRCDSGTMKC
jgi:very-short-patch-repair endonuclease